MLRNVAGPELSPFLWQVWCRPLCTSGCARNLKMRAQRVKSVADRPSNGSASENLATCCCGRKRGLLVQGLLAQGTRNG
eukprot:390834-Pleurochrysis_carterae.AAC.2